MNIQEAIDHSLVRYAKENLWGSGITTIPAQFEAAFDKLRPDDQQLVRTFFTAATTSCPVPISLAEDQKYGPAYQEVRYTSVNFWYRFLELGPLYDADFGRPVDLAFLGGRGKQDADWVPGVYQRYLIGPSTYEGYLLPRLIIDILNFASKYEIDVAWHTTHALDIIEDNATSPYTAIATLAKYMRQIGFGCQYLTDRLFDEGYRSETPQKYWRPIFEYLSEMLPEDLHFHD